MVEISGLADDQWNDIGKDTYRFYVSNGYIMSIYYTCCFNMMCIQTSFPVL